MVRIVTFLGNPGPAYSRTRHNAGWMVADRLSEKLALEWRSKFKGRVAVYSGVAYLKPETLMNRSGESVSACAAFYAVNAKDLLVVHDDIELEFGRVELKEGGGLGGHNGLRDIARTLGTPGFARLRIGVSRPAHGNVASYVLSRFATEEESDLPSILDRAVARLEEWLAKG